MNAHDTRPSAYRLSLTGFDIAGLASAAFALIWAALGVVWVQPAAAMIYADFGQAPPAFTQLCLQPWFPLALGIVPLGVTCIGIFLDASRGVRAVLMGLSLFLSFALLGVFLSGFYLPIY